MKRRTAAIGLALAVVLGVAGVAMATTWAEVTRKCPVCETKIQVREVASFGSYIYQWPSRLQMLFWPYTAGAAVHFCKHCHGAWFMGDVDELNPAQKEAIGKKLEKLREEQRAESYDEVPVAYRLKMAAALYGELGENDFFWSHFHRAVGYQLHVAGDAKGAETARGKALKVTERMLAGELDDAQRKELLIVKTSMLYLTGKRDAALESVARAKGITVSESTNLSAEKAKNINEFLGAIVTDLEKHIAKLEPLPH
jgi:hypothetical protein